MIIKSLLLCNFGVYAGYNLFEFSNSRPVVLIGGMNGRGKTTFLEAVLLSLYGANSPAFRESSYRSYGRYLRAYVSRNSPERKTVLELDFVMNEGNGNEYRIRREWDSVSKKTEEIISVSENGVYSDFLTRNWAMFVENILPCALSEFFFFDGEKIAEQVVNGSDLQMKDSIRAMLGITVLDVLQNDLNRMLKSLPKRKEMNETEVLDRLRAEKEELEEQLGGLEEQIRNLTQECFQHEKRLQSLRARFEKRGGIAVSELENLRLRKQELFSDLEQVKNTLLEAASGELPLAMTADLLREIRAQGRNEQDDRILKRSIPQIENLMSLYLADRGNSDGEGEAFLAYLKDTAQRQTGTTVYHLSDEGLDQLDSLLNGMLAESVENVEKLARRKKELEERLNETENFLSLDISEDDLRALSDSIRKEKDSLAQSEAQLESLGEKKREMEWRIQEKKSEYNSKAEAVLKDMELNEDTDRLIKYSHMALRIAGEYEKELQKRKTDMLGEAVTDCYRKLSNKKNLISRIVMDPDTLDLQYLDPEGKEVDKATLSSGEKQLMVIAVLWGLAICSKKKLPVIIDTPLARLDSTHRELLVEKYFPYVSGQTIILTTDSEIVPEYYAALKDSIGDEFTLKYDDKTRSTTISKGFFQEA